MKDCQAWSRLSVDKGRKLFLFTRIINTT